MEIMNISQAFETTKQAQQNQLLNTAPSAGLNSWLLATPKPRRCAKCGVFLRKKDGKQCRRHSRGAWPFVAVLLLAVVLMETGSIIFLAGR